MRRLGMVLGVAATLGATSSAVGQSLAGVSATEIVIGNTTPYSGPASAYGEIGRTMEAYFRMINDQGGINGRMIRVISYDDGYSPARTFEQTRRLVEEDGVALMFLTIGTEANLAVREYLNDAEVPQLLISTGASVFDDPANYPWTMRWNPTFRAEATIYADYILANLPNAKVGVLYQNDNLGREYLAGLTDRVADRLEIVAYPYDPSDPTIDAQIAALKNAGSTVFLNFATPRFAAQAIRRAAEIDWHPVQMLAFISASIGGTLRPAELENATGIISAFITKDPSSPQWADDQDVRAFFAFMRQYYPAGDPLGTFQSYAYVASSALVEILRRAGDDLSRENIMRQAAGLNVDLPLLIPGIAVATASDDFAPIEQFQLVRFDGQSFVTFGSIVDMAE